VALGKRSQRRMGLRGNLPPLAESNIPLHVYILPVCWLLVERDNAHPSISLDILASVTKAALCQEAPFHIAGDPGF
jgi:hypothetical protein